MSWSYVKTILFSLIGILGILIGAGCALEKRDQTFHLRGDYNYQFYKNHPQDYALTTVAHWAHGRIINDDVLRRSQESSLQLRHLIVQFCLGEYFCLSSPFLKREPNLRYLVRFQRKHRSQSG